MSLRSVAAVITGLLLAGCPKADTSGEAERAHPPTAECTALESHLLELGRAHPERYKDIPDTPEAWAKRWEWKCRAEHDKIDVPCLMQATTPEAIAQCPQAPDDKK